MKILAGAAIGAVATAIVGVGALVAWYVNEMDH